MNTGEQEVLNSSSLPTAGVMLAGMVSQPKRQPVIKKLLEKLLTTTSRSSASDTSRKLGALWPGAPSKKRRSYTSSASTQVPVRLQWAKICSCSARLKVQPVGLLGALSTSKRVAGVTAASNSSMSRRQRPCSGRRLTVWSWAPMTCGWAVRLGHTGVSTTTRSPASTKACMATMRAFTPPAVTAMRSSVRAAAPAGRRLWL